ncbi:transglycosylase SLT domain-containing protein [Chloroflexota bacterium]
MKMIKHLTFFCGLWVLLALACTRSAGPDPNKPTDLPSQNSPAPAPTTTLTPTSAPTPTPLPAARIISAETAFTLGMWEKALEEYLIAHESSDDPETKAAAMLGIGRTYLSSGDYIAAIEHLENLSTTYPESSLTAQAFFHLGQAYSSQDRFIEAAEAYQNYLSQKPNLIDAYIYDQKADALFAAGDYLTAAQTFRTAMTASSLLDEIFLGLKEARAYALYGDVPTALALYDDLYFRTSNEHSRALIDLRKGQAYTTLGQLDNAYAAYLDAVYKYPTSYDSYSALIALVEADVEVDELSRGLVDYHAGQYGVALAAFDRYLQQEAPVDADAATYYYGLTTRALGGHQEAVNWWDKVIDNFPDSSYKDDAWDQKAYTQWAFLDQYTLAIETLLDFVDRLPTHPRAAEFLFDAALVSERAGNLEQAADLWERVINLYPGYEQAQRAIFLTGISQYRLSNFQLALNAFQRYQLAAVNLEDRAAAQFWIGKCQYLLGAEDTAQESWQIAAGIDPTGYYSERARDLLHNRAPFSPPGEYDLMVDWESEKIKAEEWIRSTFVFPEDYDFQGLGALANDPHLVRGDELWRLGLTDEASREFDQLRLSYTNDVDSTNRLLNYYMEIGAYRPAIFAARQVLNLALMDDATTLSAPAYFNHVRFGTYYSQLIIPLAGEYNFHPLFIFSLVRQESLFDRSIQSSAAARGLMQIIPATGAEIAEDLGWPSGYSSSDLYRPAVNIKFGVDYLDKQRSSFDGNLYAALAAYNGGPGNAGAWLDLAADDQDLFLEVIRYYETRSYIRGIFEIFSIYRLIYDRTP